MNPVEKAKILADRIWAAYCDGALETNVTEPTVVRDAGGSAMALPREQMPEPQASLHLVAVTAVDTTLVVTFRWGDDDTVFVLPYDTRDVDLDPGDRIAVGNFLLHLVEFTLGGPRESWEPARATPISRRLSVVRPWNADRY